MASFQIKPYQYVKAKASLVFLVRIFYCPRYELFSVFITFPQLKSFGFGPSFNLILMVEGHKFIVKKAKEQAFMMS